MRILTHRKDIKPTIRITPRYSAANGKIPRVVSATTKLFTA
jgi:hypothetical protein